MYVCARVNRSQGPGTALGDIENVQKRIGTLTTKDASLKRLYRFVFNVPPKVNSQLPVLAHLLYGRSAVFDPAALIHSFLYM